VGPKQLADVSQIWFANGWNDKAEERPGMRAEQALAPIHNIQAAIPFVVTPTDRHSLADQVVWPQTGLCLQLLRYPEDHRTRNTQAA
jgi:hypothetical protein